MMPTQTPITAQTRTLAQHCHLTAMDALLAWAASRGAAFRVARGAQARQLVAADDLQPGGKGGGAACGVVEGSVGAVWGR
jgi:hypothetical protein